MFDEVQKYNTLCAPNIPNKPQYEFCMVMTTLFCEPGRKFRKHLLYQDIRNTDLGFTMVVLDDFKLLTKKFETFN